MEVPDLKGITAKHFDAYSENWENRLKHHSYLSRYKTVSKLLPGSVSSVVDLGCGTGDYCQLFDSLVSYTGIDNSSGMIEKAASLYPKRKFLIEDVENTSLPDNYADCVLAIGLFEYLENPKNLVAEIRRITKPGGQIICGFPNKNNFRDGSAIAKGVSDLKEKGKKLLRKNRLENANPLAPTGFVKDQRIVHRPFGQKMVLNLFESSEFSVNNFRYANFKILRYLTGMPLSRQFDEKISALISWSNMDEHFSKYASIMLSSFCLQKN